MEEHFHAEFYGFTIDSEQGLSFAGKTVELRPKEFQMLLLLVRRAGARVSKEELIKHVWNSAPTSDESISRCLSVLKSTLRKVSPGTELLIKTEYGQGYRFIGEIGKPATLVNEENFFLLINATRNIIILKDDQNRWQIANNACLQLFDLMGKAWQGKTSAELAQICNPNWQEHFECGYLADEQTWERGDVVEYTIQKANDPNNPEQFDRAFEITKTPIFEPNGNRKALIVLGQEITDRLENERHALLMHKVLSNSDEAVLICDQLNNIVYANTAFTNITGYTMQEVRGKNPRLLASGRHDKIFFQKMWRQINSDGNWFGEIWDKRKNGEIYLKWLNISTVHENNGALANYVGIFSDITQKKADEAMLSFLAYHDPLTQLPNRLLLRDRYHQALNLAHRHQQGSLALLYLDLDQFKNINDTLGHEIGDRLLIAVAKRLETNVREIDTVSRIGGDEFVIILTEMPDSQSIAMVAQKILGHLAENYEIDDYNLTTTISIGITICSKNNEDFDALLSQADAAMYHAKNSGRNTYRFYTDQMTTDSLQQLQVRIELAEAINKEQFMLYYQPQFDLHHARLVGLEALIRWNHPEKGIITPDKFINIAETTGQIVPIGEWAISEACRQAKEWQVQGYEPIKIAVNLSSLHFKRGDIIKMMTDLTDRHQIDPKFLELELTESVLLNDVDYILDIMKKFRNLRFTLTIDDFGSGYSSLAVLKRFRVDKLKIDNSFVQNLEVDRHDLAIIRSVVQLANGFDMKTIAEGIETAGQLEILRREGCHEGQGYYFKHPLNAVQISREVLTLG